MHFRTLLVGMGATVLSQVAAAATPHGALDIELAGQSMIRSDLRVTAPAQFAAMRSLLHGDVIFTNLEGAVAEPGQSVHQGRGFLMPPAALGALQGLGFNLLALSDNHAADLGVTGIDNTLREVDRLGLVHAGTGDTLQAAAAPAYLSTPQGTVALVASASGLLSPGAAAGPHHPGVDELRVEAGTQQNEATADLPNAPDNRPNPTDAARILASIRAARRHADVVIVYQHNHVFGRHSFSTIFSEGMAERLAPNPWLRQWTHEEIDAGADIVVMHGAPLLHGIELYHGRPIFYDLGNFIYNLPPTLVYIDEPIAWEGALATVRFEQGRLRSIELRATVLNEIGQGQPDVHDPYDNNQYLDTRGLPAAASPAKAHYILGRLAELSRPFGTVLHIEGDRASIELPGEVSARAAPAR